MAPLNIEICWRSGGFETGLATSYPANDMHDAVAFRRGDPKFVKSARLNELHLLKIAGRKTPD